MRYHTPRTALALALIAAAAAFAPAAFAGNDDAAGTPKGTYRNYNKNGDLSQFEQLKQNTQTYRKDPSGRYTEFVPTNRAFEKLSANEYPALYVANPPKEAATIVSNHIVPGEVNLKDVVRMKGGVFAANGRFLPVMEGQKGDYYIDGQRILSSTMTAYGMRYVIDGVIANGIELAAIKSIPVVQTAGNVTVVVPENTSIIQEQRYTPSAGQTTTTTIVTPNY